MLISVKGTMSPRVLVVCRRRVGTSASRRTNDTRIFGGLPCIGFDRLGYLVARLASGIAFRPAKVVHGPDDVIDNFHDRTVTLLEHLAALVEYAYAGFHRR